MNRFAPGGLFYDRYRELSEAVHPSYATLQAYTDVHGHHTVTRVDRRGHETAIETVTEVLGLAAVLAMDVLERLRSVGSRLEEVEKAAANAGLPANLAVEDSEPHRQPSTRDRPR